MLRSILQDINTVLTNILCTWTKDTYCTSILAVDALHNEVHPASNRACRWCAIGIVYKVAQQQQLADYTLVQIENTLNRMGHKVCISYTSDVMGHSYMREIMASTQQWVQRELEASNSE